MQTGKKINQISNRLRRRSRAIQETIGISGAQGNILNYILVESQNRSVYQKDIEQEFGLRPSTATEALKSLKKKFKDKRFAAGCSREIITRGAEQLGWELEKLLTMTMEAMKATEDTINAECESL